jgi:SAM-dependent methyltransferase
MSAPRPGHANLWPAYIEPLVRYFALLPFQQLQLRVAALADLPPLGGRVVELGCGPGAAGLWALSELGIECDYVGLDRDPAILDRAGMEARRYRRRLSSVRLLQADLNEAADSWPVAGEQFDAGISVNLWYLLADGRRTLSEAAGLIRPGGRLVISTPGPNADRLAVLVEHLRLLIPGDDHDSEVMRRRSAESQRILSFLEGEKPANDQLTSDPANTFIDRTAIESWVDPELWNIRHFEEIYGDPCQNGLIVLQRQ